MMSSFAAQRLPRWMDSFLHTNFFGRFCAASPVSKCSTPKKHCNMFCIDCIDGPFCSACTLKHNRSHRFLQAFKSAGHASVETSDIGRFIDTEDIGVFHIDGADIFFLRRRQTEGKLPSRTCHKCCRTCNWKLDNDALYCSIECKVMMMRSWRQPKNFPQLISEQLEPHQKLCRPYEASSSHDSPNQKK